MDHGIFAKHRVETEQNSSGSSGSDFEIAVLLEDVLLPHPAAAQGGAPHVPKCNELPLFVFQGLCHFRV